MIVNVETRKPLVLIVDDDKFVLHYLQLSLKQGNFEVVTAGGVDEAQKVLEERGIHNFFCVLTDYRMPEKTGLDLLKWINDHDGTLGTIIITAEGEKQLVQSFLRGGAVDFLEKPASKAQIINAVLKGVESTQKNRRLWEVDAGVKAAGELNQIFKAIRIPEKYQHNLKYFFHPIHDVGGDFINVLSLEDERLFFIAGDISGHDVRAAFVSAYFQGLVRALVEKKCAIEEIIPLISKILYEEWNEVKNNSNALTIPTSLCIYAALADLNSHQWEMLVCGFPSPMVVEQSGKIYPCGEDGHALGWFAVSEFKKNTYNSQNWSAIYAFSDGLIDYAKILKINFFTLIYLINTVSKEDLKKLLNDATDDILLMIFQVAEQETTALAIPIMYEKYSGDQIKDIDNLQYSWEWSLKYCFPKSFGNRFTDFLVCIREGILNALEYGCLKSPDKYCSLQICFYEKENKILVRIDDPGSGHNFRITTQLDIDGQNEHQDLHLGLAIINNLSDVFYLENNGASVVFEFHLQRFSENGNANTTDKDKLNLPV